LPLFGPPDVARLAAKGDFEGLLAALTNRREWRARQDAAEAFGRVGDTRAVGPLIAALKDDVPDAVVLDRLTCYPLLEKIVRTVSRMSRKPHVVVVTARTSISDRLDLLSSGVDFVFTKLRPVTELGLVLRRLGRPDAD